MYTSGSTGEPKGVAIEHRSVVNLLTAMRLDLGLTADDVMLGLTALTFDISVLELVLPLVVGARVVIAQKDAAGNVDYLRSLIADAAITAVQATPITWRLLLDSGWSPPASLKVMSGGEALPTRLADELVTAAASMCNLYGPTETTIWSTLQSLDRPGQPVTIGRPIANTQAYILDSALRPVPGGTVGDLHLAGLGLARGYIRRPHETAERFRPNPHSRHAGARMYRTGDLARLFADGEIEFRGRSDHQVKIRGIRIETEAISSVLNRHPGVGESVVVVIEDAARGTHLAAYVVPRPTASLRPRELRTYLRDHIPAYMVPSALVELSQLPRTPTNKVDRKGLPAPCAGDYRQAGEVVGARNPAEQAITAIWCDVLMQRDIGIHDDFFELGGNSLKAIRLLLKVNGRLNVKISMKQFLDAPSISALAEHAAKQTTGGASLPQARIERLPRGRYYSLAPQQEQWLQQELMIGRLHPNHIQLALLTGEIDALNLEQAVLAVERRHEALRTSFQIRDDRCVQVIAPAGGLRVRFVDLSELPAELRKAELGRLAHADGERPFDLRCAPLFRFYCFRLAAAEHMLVLCGQHLICDGWSLDVIVSEIAEVYRCHRLGEPARLSPLPVQYVDFAEWQRRWLQTPDFTSHLAFWLRRLVPRPPLLFQVTNHSESDFELARLCLHVPNSIFGPAKRRSRELGCSLFSAVAAALTFALHRAAGESDVSIVTMAANRGLPDTGSVVGLFTNPIVLRTDVGQANTIRQILLRVQATVKDAFVHQELPFDAVVQMLEKTQQFRKNDLVQVMLLWQGAPDEPTQVPAIQTQLVSLDEYKPAIESLPTTLELLFEMREVGDQLECRISYKRHHFPSGQMRIMFGDLAGFLEGLGLDPDRPADRTAPDAAPSEPSFAFEHDREKVRAMREFG